MTKQRIRRWTWILTALFAVVSFVYIAVIQRQPLAYALIVAVICGLLPLFVGAWLLFSPSTSVKSPLRYMGYKPPEIVHTSETDERRVVRRPSKKGKRPH